MHPDDIVTPPERPVRNMANRPMVTILHNLALTLEATPRALLAIAQAIQDDAAPVHDLNREKIAQILDEHAATVSAAATEIREG